MKKQETNEKEILQNLYDLRRQSRERYLKLMGVDVKTLRELERDIDREFGELVASLHEQRRQEGKERAERHTKIIGMSQESLSNDVEKAIHANLSTPASIFDHLVTATLADPPALSLDPRMPFMSPLWCHCHYPKQLSNNRGHDDRITILPPSGGTGTATVTYDTSLNQAQPYADVRGGGTGYNNTASLRTWYKFDFEPETTSSYCIRPMVSMNGWWLLWTWGTCGGTSEDLGNGTVWVKLRVKVDQLSVTVKEIEHTVLDQSLSGGADSEGAVDYASERDGGSSMIVRLQGGDQAVIFVECEVYTQISSHGRAIVDMQSGSGFYFKVPQVCVGKCHPHWRDLVEAIQLGRASASKSQ